MTDKCREEFEKWIKAYKKSQWDEWNANDLFNCWQAAQPKWLPIESAPRDGATALLYAPGWNSPKTGWTFDDVWQDCPFSYIGNPSYTPTYWMPLPEAPKGGV